MHVVPTRFRERIHLLLVPVAVLGVSVALVSCTAAGAWDMFVALGAEARRSVPFDPADFSYAHELVLDNSAQTGSLVDFPLLVKLTPARVDYAGMRTDGSDIRFADGTDGTPLDFEVEHWEHAGDSLFWVRVPRIDGGSASGSIWIYYGNPDAAPAEDPAAVWKPHYIGVWHLHDDLLDSTSYGHHGTGTATTATTGVIGRGREFNGTSSSITMEKTAAFDLAGAFTMEAWAYKRGVAEQFVMSKWQTNPNRRSYAMGFKLYTSHEGPFVLISANGNSSPDGILEAPASEAVDRWMHLAAVYDTTSLRLYVDGEEAASLTPALSPLFQNDENFTIGASASGTSDFFNGIVDEPRLSSVARSADWIAAQYLAMTDRFIRYGAKQVLQPQQ